MTETLATFSKGFQLADGVDHGFIAEVKPFTPISLTMIRSLPIWVSSSTVTLRTIQRVFQQVDSCGLPVSMDLWDKSYSKVS